MRPAHAGDNIAFFKRIALAVGLAALVTLPFLIAHKEPVIGKLVWPHTEYAAGDVAEVKCPFNMPRQNNATCYRAYVPQNWETGEGPVISILALVLAPARGVSIDDPFLYLEGGPGFAGVPKDYEDFGRNGWLRYNYEKVLETGRAMIFVDTRGLGHAEPALHCPKALDAAWEDLKVPPQKRELMGKVLQADIECFRALTAEGVMLGAYNSDHAARDLQVLRRGLGIGKWNVYGISYGAQTALNLLNVDREGVRTVIFDSPSYDRIEVFQDDQASFDRIIDQMASTCANAEASWYIERCSGLKERLIALQDKLRDDPITVRGQPFGNAVYMGDREALLIFHDILYAAGGQDSFLSFLETMETKPSSYFNSLSDWAMDWHQTLYWSYLDEDFSWPVHLSTTCLENDHGPSSEGSPWPVYTIEEQTYSRLLCEEMGLVFNNKVIDAAKFKGIPALVLSGHRDVITPPAYGKDLATDIEGAHFVHPRESHGVMFWTYDECVYESAIGFVETRVSDIDTDCIWDGTGTPPPPPNSRP